MNAASPLPRLARWLPVPMLPIGICLIAMTVVAGAVSFDRAHSVVVAPISEDIEGVLDGAPFYVRVPAGWNGTLLLFAHGYGRRVEPYVPVTPAYNDRAQEEHFLRLGYALAGSAYASAGWAVKEGIRDTLALHAWFSTRFGAPQRTVLWGRSLGSIVTLRSIEDHPDAYDAAIPMCAVGAGTSRFWDSLLDVAWAYDVVLGWPSTWGTLAEARGDVRFFRDVLPVIREQLREPENFGRFEFVRRVNRLPLASFYEPPDPNGDPNHPANMPLMIQLLFFLTEGRAELQARAGGGFVQNRDHRYTLKESDRSDLVFLGIPVNDFLRTMNTGTVIEADPSARSYLQRFADYSGNLRRPVLALYGTGDVLVPAQHAAAYADTVDAQGKEDWLRQVFTPAVAHCDYSTAQLDTVVRAAERWLDSGEQPDDENFPTRLGFLPEYEPAPFPQPARGSFHDDDDE